jgi:UDP-N-acetylglucosamine--N-acetylmuramyl-(pentapeptide) pyrophosphoryl-undecaprenol N-acetylglucosamine transferase
MMEMARNLKQVTGETLRIIHQTGKADLAEVEKCYLEAGISAQQNDFFDDMAMCYERADLVVSRAGATTLAELSVLGLPALLIPYPYAADNHQELNARYYATSGGVRIFKEPELNDELFYNEIKALLHNPQELHNMAQKIKKLGKPDATEHIVNECLQLAASS